MPNALVGFTVLVAVISAVHGLRRPDRRWPWDAVAAVAWLVLGVIHATGEPPWLPLMAVADGWLAGLLTRAAVDSWGEERRRADRRRP